MLKEIRKKIHIFQFIFEIILKNHLTLEISKPIKMVPSVKCYIPLGI